MMAMRRYLEARLAAARLQGGEGLIAELVRVEKESGRISAREMVAMVFLLLGAGSETTTHLISGSVYELIRNPQLRDWLEQDWSRANLAIEEFLRFVSPVQFTKPRYVRRDVELGGVLVRKGERIMAMLAAANMDPGANAHPERLDLTRAPNRHLSFGTGIHFCLGHQLARIEGKGAGRDWHWVSRNRRSDGGSGRAFGRSQACPLWSTPNEGVGRRRGEVRHTYSYAVNECASINQSAAIHAEPAAAAIAYHVAAAVRSLQVAPWLAIGPSAYRSGSQGGRRGASVAWTCAIWVTRVLVRSSRPAAASTCA
jgi:hypothetical protein